MSTLPKPGSRLGRFLIKRKLGASDSGVVFLALDSVLETPVALKIFSQALAREDAYKAISREILLSRRINHSGVCRVHDLHEEQGHRFLTMDYVPGPTLARLLHQYRRKGMPITRAVRIIAGAGEAVTVAHKEQIIHRNLKPSNVVVGDNDLVTVMDFGQAMAHDMGGRTAVRVDQSDVTYIAQEVLFGQTATAASDQYSLGSMLYECMTGTPILQTMGAVKEASGFRGSKPTAPSKLNRQVTRALEQVVMTAVAANPESRFRSVEEFTAELLDCQEDLSVRSRRPRQKVKSASVAATGATDADQAVADRMERATLLFSDIVGITAFFDAHGDVAGRQRIDQHNELLFPVIRRHDGSVLKTIGDAIMASFPDEDEAVEAAIQMQQTLDNFNELRRREQDRIQIRIGINTGEAIVEYGDAYGDAVNVAARVCSKADGEQILISEDTCHQLTRNRDIINAHSEVTLKGKRELFRLYQVDWLLAEELDQEEDEAQPPDLSTDEGEDQNAAVDATAIVDTSHRGQVFEKASDVVDNLAQAAQKISTVPTSLLDRFYGFIGIERNSKTTFALLLVVLTALVLLLGLLYLMCGGGTEVVVDGPAAPSDVAGPFRP